MSLTIDQDIPENNVSLFPRWRRRLRNFISKYPSIYLPLARGKLPEGYLVTPQTEIVIEGYPRSANSFAEAAFRVSQPEPVRMAHHAHAAAQVIAGIQWKIPTLVIFRDPEEAVRSLVMLRPHIYTAYDGYREYLTFYKTILPYRSQFVLSSFQDTTKSFDRVMRRINQRFGTEFVEFENTEEQTKLAYELVDHISATIVGPKNVDYSLFLDEEHHIQRKKKQAAVQDLLKSKSAAKVRQESQDLYKKMCDLSDNLEE
jgi:hypothetical protein